jgi:hypothetical protein
MKNTEIRIGNYVYRNDILVTVDEQTFWDMKNNPEQYKPILISGHWLILFMFEKKTTSWTNWQRPSHIKEVRLNINGNRLLHNGLKIEFVHQLQNLYFALTNQELKA